MGTVLKRSPSQQNPELRHEHSSKTAMGNKEQERLEKKEKVIQGNRKQATRERMNLTTNPPRLQGMSNVALGTSQGSYSISHPTYSSKALLFHQETRDHNPSPQIHVNLCVYLCN